MIWPQEYIVPNKPSKIADSENIDYTIDLPAPCVSSMCPIGTSRIGRARRKMLEREVKEMYDEFPVTKPAER